MCVWVEAEEWVWKLKNWVSQQVSDHSPALEANHGECHLTLWWIKPIIQNMQKLSYARYLLTRLTCRGHGTQYLSHVNLGCLFLHSSCKECEWVPNPERISWISKVPILHFICMTFLPCRLSSVGRRFMIMEQMECLHACESTSKVNRTGKGFSVKMEMERV